LAGDPGEEDRRWEETNELFERVQKWTENHIRAHIMAHPDEWDWDLLAADREIDREYLNVDDWFEKAGTDEYFDDADRYAAVGGPMSATEFPQLEVWLEGTNLASQCELTPEVAFYGSELRSESYAFLTLEVWQRAREKIAHEFDLDDARTIADTVYRKHRLPSYRTHVSPTGNIRLKPSWAR
jgi:hypothetical protein